MHARMIHSHSGETTPIPYGKQGQVSCSQYFILLCPPQPCVIILQAPVVQTLDSAIHRINHYPADKYYGNQLRYLLDSDLSGG